MCSASKVEYEALSLLIGAVTIDTESQSCSNWLRNHSLTHQPCNGTSIHGGFLLCRVEICRHCHNASLDGALKLQLSTYFTLCQYLGGDELWVESFNLTIDSCLIVWSFLSALDQGERPSEHILLDVLIVELEAQQPLRVIEGVVQILHHLVYRGIAHNFVSILFNGYNGWYRLRTRIILHDIDSLLVLLPDTDAGVRGAEINAHPDFLGIVVLRGLRLRICLDHLSQSNFN